MMKQIGIVVLETYRRQVKSWSFLLLVLSPFIFLLLSFGVGYLSATATKGNAEKVAIIAAPKQLTQQLVVDQKNTTTRYQTVATAQKALSNKDLKGYLVVKKTAGRLQATYHGTEKLSQTQSSHFLQVLTAYQQSLNLQQAKLNQQQLTALQTTPQLRQKVTHVDKNNDDAVKLVSFMLLLFLMYFILLTYTTTVAQDIASEKGTKIMEVIFSSMPARNYFYGKILGTLSVIITHLLIYVLGGIAFFLMAPQLAITKKVFNENHELITKVLGNLANLNLLYVLLGVIIFTVLAALCGSLVVRPEDTSKAIQPVMYLVMVGFFGALILGQTDDNLIVKVASFIPFLSSFFMPIRLINEHPAGWQVGLSLLLLLASTVGLSVYVGNLYSGLILQTDDVGMLKSFRRGLKIK
ncbi:ABC transporter permease [Liquorilactobacillus satsumensis]|uniref:ABC transporter permease n=1 Tax=Liquorilactobacillus satsumensis TaxID=259059 RepID=UPI001E5F4D5A|nr:ABC transporter permease [Liquorilactobacillus satsumensis]